MPLFFVACLLDESLGSREVDYDKFNEVLKIESASEKLKRLQKIDEAMKEPYGKAHTPENLMKTFMVDKSLWFVKFEGVSNYLKAYIEKKSGVIKQNDTLIVIEVEPKNIAIQYPEEYEVHKWIAITTINKSA